MVMAEVLLLLAVLVRVIAGPSGVVRTEYGGRVTRVR